MEPKPLIVTGATGHLGNVLVRALLGRGRPVRAVVQPGDDLTPLAGLPVEVVRADVNERPALLAAFEGGDVVFHLAGIVSIGAGGDARMVRVNVDGTANVVEACAARGVRRLVHVGSVHALVEPSGPVLDEAAGFDPSRAAGAYGRTKAMACLAVQRAARAGVVDAVLVLPTGVVGPWDYRLSEMGQLIVGLGDGRVRVLVAGGYDFVDVRDVADGLIAAAERGRRGEAYVLGGGRLDMRQLARAVARAAGRRPAWVLPAWVGHLAAAGAPLFERVTGRRALVTAYSMHVLGAPFAVSHEKAARELGFRPRPPAASVADAWRWHLSDPSSPLNRRLRALGPGRLVAREAP
ncbi:MAG: NAD-dependent epimerase/dehydratase family protein [Myxococcota bacterium]